VENGRNTLIGERDKLKKNKKKGRKGKTEEKEETKEVARKRWQTDKERDPEKKDEESILSAQRLAPSRNRQN